MIYVKTNTLGEKKYLIVNWTREIGRTPKLHIYFTDVLRNASVLEQEISQDVYEHFMQQCGDYALGVGSCSC